MKYRLSEFLYSAENQQNCIITFTQELHKSKIFHKSLLYSTPPATIPSAQQQHAESNENRRNFIFLSHNNPNFANLSATAKPVL
ncbi:hypothetical protein [Botryobacter ruber]|uniref:hypothetical protein n=1 Tax=Botryobacter ruber TaxID=2171629 RepID=UPI000F64FED8|nr:hypothetical protein [Botryobacter ruber]